MKEVWREFGFTNDQMCAWPSTPGGGGVTNGLTNDLVEVIDLVNDFGNKFSRFLKHFFIFGAQFGHLS